MSTVQAPDAKAITLMVVLCAIWGLQQVVLKATAADIAPVWQIGLRSAAAAVLVGLVMLARGERSHWHRVDADEIWLWHAGAPLILRLGETVAKAVRLGLDVLGDEVVQALVPQGW